MLLLLLRVLLLPLLPLLLLLLLLRMGPPRRGTQMEGIPAKAAA